MHSTLRRAAPDLPAGERDRALEGLGAGMFYAWHGTICILQAETSTLYQAREPGKWVRGMAPKNRRVPNGRGQPTERVKLPHGTCGASPFLG
jgi:hypothetical protein